ncbi:unnamed protein product [Mytilus coruscus]|uniref:DNA-directed DNA polymerase n=1 Tax=Mytilus coruscus TaxID=42192 RepID=A0A6J8DG48_MYTCO|nr:unnamed protein product [Mytilus coruscus]
MVCTDGYAPREPCGRQFPMRNEICASSEAGEPKASCSDGYVPRGGEVKYNLETRCEKCRLRVKCDQSWCGLTEHKVNFAVLQSSCVKCQNEELTKDSKCNSCGSRCDTCSVLRKKLIPLPCENRCGFRQRVFRGKDVPQQFCSHIMTPCYKNTVMAHNAKGFDNYPILNCLLEKHGVKPNKIIVDGSKINYMHVSKGLDLTFLDSLNFIQMKLSKIPECFGLREVTKGYFPHLFNTGKSIVSRSVSRYTENQRSCICTDSNRSMIGTWCIPELELARSKGYRILKIYEIYNIAETKIYDRQTGKGGLFDGYVNLFLKLKQEASGFPSECETEQQKMDYIADYAKKEGILLDYDKIRKNPGLRNLAKICLNSFWGKFGQRLNMKQTTFFTENEADKFFQLLSDPKKDVRDFHIINKNTVKTEHFDYPSFIPIDYSTNVFIASFTTCWARISLYKVLEKTDENALYVDTDSVIFVDRNKEITNTLPIGNYLGELTNEISTEVGYITHFVSGSPEITPTRWYQERKSVK